MNKILLAECLLRFIHLLIVASPGTVILLINGDGVQEFIGASMLRGLFFGLGMLFLGIVVATLLERLIRSMSRSSKKVI